jgi:hypothetical protein
MIKPNNKRIFLEFFLVLPLLLIISSLIYGEITFNKNYISSMDEISYDESNKSNFLIMKYLLSAVFLIVLIPLIRFYYLRYSTILEFNRSSLIIKNFKSEEQITKADNLFITKSWLLDYFFNTSNVVIQVSHKRYIVQNLNIEDIYQIEDFFDLKAKKDISNINFKTWKFKNKFLYLSIIYFIFSLISYYILVPNIILSFDFFKIFGIFYFVFLIGLFSVYYSKKHLNYDLSNKNK